MKDSKSTYWPLGPIFLAFLLFFAKAVHCQTFTQCQLHDRYGTETLDYTTTFDIQANKLKVTENGLSFEETISFKRGSDDLLILVTETGEYRFFSEDGFCYLCVYIPLMGAERRYFAAKQ